jgi:hypothetical protein
VVPEWRPYRLRRRPNQQTAGATVGDARSFAARANTPVEGSPMQCLDAKGNRLGVDDDG